VSSLTADLRGLGIHAGMTLLVHTSLKAIGQWVVGGPQAVILALEAALEPQGTLVMPTMTGELSDPAAWQHPPVPQTWWELIRREMPPYMPDLSTTRAMGAVAETFRKQDGVLRSSHPQTSFAAWGKHARFVVADHALESPLGEGSPLARIYDLDGQVLLLGVEHGNNTSLHLAEDRALYPGKKRARSGTPMLVAGERRWVEFEHLHWDDADFPQVGVDFERDTNSVRLGRVGAAAARLMAQRPLVDYAAQWFERNRK
jgi:aminoglycoside 3-N-acetyltransferase